MTAAADHFLASRGDKRVFHGVQSVQNFAHYARNTLRIASPIVAAMQKSLVQIVAQNVQRALDASQYDSYRSLAIAAGVAPNTVRHVVQPDSRPPGPRGETSPRLDVLDKIAAAMGYEGWQLLQANFDPENRPSRVLTAREAEWYEKIEALYRQLPPDTKGAE